MINDGTLSKQLSEKFCVSEAQALLISTAVIGSIGKVGAKAGSLKNPPLSEQSAALEKTISRLPPSERVAQVKQAVGVIAKDKNRGKDSTLTRMNGRDVYRTPEGEMCALDSQRGRLEKIDPKKRTHLGEFTLHDQIYVPNSLDRSGGHNLRIK